MPVTREEIYLERRPLEAARELEPGEIAFEEKEFLMSASEEDVTIRKQTIVREKVRLSKLVYNEDVPLSVELKSEHVDIKKEAS